MSTFGPINSAEYHRLLRKVKRESIFDNFNDLYLRHLENSSIGVSHKETTDEVKSIFIELQIIAIKEGHALSETNLSEFVEAWISVFPNLTIRMSSSTYITESEKNVLIAFIRNTEDVLDEFVHYLYEEMSDSLIRIGDIPVEPKHTYGMIGSDKVLPFCSEVVSLDIQLVK